jgi:hypothetical protein
MGKEFIRLGTDWENTGYFGAPQSFDDVSLSPDARRDQWRVWLAAFARAREGDFSLVAPLLDVLMQSVPSTLAMACSDLIGDAGPPACFSRIVNEIGVAQSFEMVDELTSALHLRGMLSDVRLLLDAYERYHENKDADILPVRISDLIESDDGLLSEPAEFTDMSAYRSAVISRCTELEDRFGTDRVIVFHGDRFGAARLAQYMLERVRMPYASSYLRHKFEAATGIDCTAFYKDKTLQPLAASAILEQFLESPAAETFETGVRYFFGHRIPA